jgi:uncharacterized protein YuzE
MNHKSGPAFSQRIVIESPGVISVCFREGALPILRKQGETILDLNRLGNWVRGIEIVGGFVPFSVAEAVSPFNPVPPTFPEMPNPGTVTYDPDADAAFMYLEYDPDLAQLTPQSQGELKTVSHSVNPTATYGLDRQGGIVWIKIPVADITGTAEQFLRLLRR